MDEDEAPNLHGAVHIFPGPHFTTESTQRDLAIILICLAAVLASCLGIAAVWRCKKKQRHSPDCSVMAGVVRKLREALPVVCSVAAGQGGEHPDDDDVEKGKGEGGEGESQVGGGVKGETQVMLPALPDNGSLCCSADDNEATRGGEEKGPLCPVTSI